MVDRKKKLEMKRASKKTRSSSSALTVDQRLDARSKKFVAMRKAEKAASRPATCKSWFFISRAGCFSRGHSALCSCVQEGSDHSVCSGDLFRCSSYTQGGIRDSVITSRHPCGTRFSRGDCRRGNTSGF
jgi:hypothetical protein